MLVKAGRLMRGSICVLLLILISMLVSVSLLGCSGQSENSRSQSSSLTPQDIQIVDKWCKSDTEFTSLSPFYLFVENPNDDYWASNIKVNLTFKSSDGTVLDTQKRTISYLLAKQKTALVGDFNCLGKEVASIETTVTVSSTDWSKQDTSGDGNSVYPIENLSLTPVQYGGYTLTGEVENTTDGDVRSGEVFAIFKNSIGEVVDAKKTYVSDFASGTKAAFSITVDYRITEVSTYEVYFMPQY